MNNVQIYGMFLATPLPLTTPPINAKKIIVKQLKREKYQYSERGALPLKVINFFKQLFMASIKLMARSFFLLLDATSL
jgi:hypothetical protein